MDYPSRTLMTHGMSAFHMTQNETTDGQVYARPSPYDPTGHPRSCMAGRHMVIQHKRPRDLTFRRHIRHTSQPNNEVAWNAEAVYLVCRMESILCFARFFLSLLFLPPETLRAVTTAICACICCCVSLCKWAPNLKLLSIGFIAGGKRHKMKIIETAFLFKFLRVNRPILWFDEREGECRLTRDKTNGFVNRCAHLVYLRDFVSVLRDCRHMPRTLTSLHVDIDLENDSDARGMSFDAKTLAKQCPYLWEIVISADPYTTDVFYARHTEMYEPDDIPPCHSESVTYTTHIFCHVSLLWFVVLTHKTQPFLSCCNREYLCYGCIHV